jgi:hypothetical protein
MIGAVLLLYGSAGQLDLPGAVQASGLAHARTPGCGQEVA